MHQVSKEKINEPIFEVIKHSSNEVIGGTEIKITYRNEKFLLIDSHIPYSNNKRVALYIVKNYEKILMQGELFVWITKGLNAMSYSYHTPWPLVKPLAIKYIDDLSS
jgi:hypothetical protein